MFCHWAVSPGLFQCVFCSWGDFSLSFLDLLAAHPPSRQMGLRRPRRNCCIKTPVIWGRDELAASPSSLEFSLPLPGSPRASFEGAGLSRKYPRFSVERRVSECLGSSLVKVPQQVGSESGWDAKVTKPLPLVTKPKWPCMNPMSLCTPWLPVLQLSGSEHSSKTC